MQEAFSKFFNGLKSYLASEFFPSSKLFSNYGQINNDLTLKERAWTYSECETTHDRDENASVNLKAEGIRILKEERKVTIFSNDDTTTVGTTESNAFGEDVRPTKILESYFSYLP